MPDQLALPRCVLPGCKQSVGRWGDVCDGCLDAFGSRLRPAGQPLTETQIRDRDNDIHAAYVRQAMTRRTT